jgi:hypothetical protein
MTFTHVTHRKWKQRLIEIHTQLKEWEQEHNGKLTFSKAFDSLVLKLKTKHTIVQPIDSNVERFGNNL